jgi:hypothetical protein
MKATTMSQGTEFTIGRDVLRTDGLSGSPRCVVVDQVACVVTHLVVELRHGRASSRLVPVDLVSSTLLSSTLVNSMPNEVRLRCQLSEFTLLDYADDISLLPALSGQWGYGEEELLLWP